MMNSPLAKGEGAFPKVTPPMTFYAVIVMDGRSTLFGPYDSEDEREQSLGVRLFDHPSGIALRLNSCEGRLSLSEHEPLVLSTQHEPEIFLFDPRP